MFFHKLTKSFLVASDSGETNNTAHFILKKYNKYYDTAVQIPEFPIFPTSFPLPKIMELS
jgi:hypothetical protein